MARIIKPTTAAGYQKLQANIKTKHDEDGDNSVLTIFLEENEIDLTADNTALVKAVKHHDNFTNANNKAEELSKAWKKLFNPAFSGLTKAVQFLKALYKTNVRKLGDWGVTVNNDSKIIYPADFVSRYNLFVKFYDKHKTFLEGKSPLHNFLMENEIDFDKMKTDADKANTNYTGFGKEDKKAEEEKQLRDKAMATPVKNTDAICNFLMKTFATNPKKLGQYGITVDDSPRGSVRRTITINPGLQKTVSGALIGGFFSNTGNTKLELRAGRKGDGKILSVEAGKEFVIEKGFSIFIVSNTSLDSKGSYSVDVSR